MSTTRDMFTDDKYEVKFQNNTHGAVAILLLMALPEWKIKKSVIINVLKEVWPDTSFPITVREIAQELLKRGHRVI
ncbi:hypothetical protein PBCVCVR1_365L [Paramecium bursaria Chlorella virus CVR-1]|uniref:Uncharacterized protein n=1 Tax=Paramecium bursaria Chlorella virus CVA-1 TaxID=42683 RepID=M1HVQ6_9PHYC|nr:hypothetical protein F8205_gp120 [Paramecium bursaria Chlorella virus CVA-1]AGE50475.1 hypothetical protein PBCVCVA1_357L [Paramecium bursaria Chlorella virus CVA-1]AGE52155.1 hypothetical protein PBCVCVR1_365L [Paramecium bursaria Chlorella virus CVR-1]